MAGYKLISKNLTAEEFANDLSLEIAVSGKDLKLDTNDVSRPGLLLTGFSDYFRYKSVQVLGNAEFEYLSKFSYEEKLEKLESLFKKDIPCVIVCHGRSIPEIIETAKKYNMPLFATNEETSNVVYNLMVYLTKVLAPFETIHAGLMDVFGLGVLLIGKSGIGKSETALELVKRGHRLCADDSVTIKRINNIVLGSGPESTRYFMEIRGVGIIDIFSMYGAASVILEKRIELVVELENFDDKKKYERIGEEPSLKKILGLNIPKITVPVMPGRNISIIIEVAARNMRLSQQGYNAAKEIMKRNEKNIE